jgi:hypothetical protein
VINFPKTLTNISGMKRGSKILKKVFICPECNLSYKDAKWAKKCAAWCKERKSCNLEIIKHAVQKTPLERAGLSSGVKMKLSRCI